MTSIKILFPLEILLTKVIFEFTFYHQQLRLLAKNHELTICVDHFMPSAQKINRLSQEGGIRIFPYLEMLNWKKNNQ